MKKNTDHHVVVIPYPAQGHVMPLLEAARSFAIKGLKVTFVNTEETHSRLMKTTGPTDHLFRMVSIPDGMEPSDHDGSNDFGKLTSAIFQLMPSKLEELIGDINENDDHKVTCIVADFCMGWVARVARKTGIRLAVFCPCSAAVLGVTMSIQKLIDDGVISSRGAILKDQMVQLSSSMPLMNPANFVWACMGDPVTNQILFDFLFLQGKEAAKTADRIICNSTIDLEPGVFSLFPKMLPIGPLLAANRSTRQVGHFWNEDSSCLTWLDQQPARSVIYVAFGSITIFNQTQFEELALGLEDCEKPFLWVVRPGTSGSNDYDYDYPDGYLDRISSRGKLVSWAPQQEVLSHPSVACFISHCGWNSTMEGVSNGVPFLCWPYFSDQFFNKTYICDMWKNGVGLNIDHMGIIRRGEIKSKVEEVMSDKLVVENVLNLQEKVMDRVQPGNSSYENFNNFIEWVKEENDVACVI